jgi:hypothetical protein
MRGRETLCQSCNRETQTIHGLCPHCGAAKEGGPPTRARKLLPGDFWGDFDDAAFFLFPVVVVILVVFFILSDLLLLAALVLLVAVVVPLAIKLLDDF